MNTLSRLPRFLSVFLVTTAMLAISAPSAGATVFSNSAGITIRDAGTTPPHPVGIADPYGSGISVSGLTGAVTDVNVTLTGFTHAFPDDVDMVLKGAGGGGGDGVKVMSDAGDATSSPGVDLVLDDSAAAFLPTTGPLSSGTYKPTDQPEGGGATCTVTADTFPLIDSSANPDRHTTTLSSFNGTNPNGDWSLWVVDDCGDGAGSITGWSLDVRTTTTPPLMPPSNSAPPQTLPLSTAGIAAGQRAAALKKCKKKKSKNARKNCIKRANVLPV